MYAERIKTAIQGRRHSMSRGVNEHGVIRTQKGSLANENRGFMKQLRKRVRGMESQILFNGGLEL